MKQVIALEDADDVHRFGGKAANLAKLLQSGLPVPNGLAVSIEAFTADGSLIGEARNALGEFDPKKLYAVRSSALAEDAEDASWAGQFETFLNTKVTDVIARVEECHNSAKARAKAYASERGDKSKLNVAVVVQEMLKPEYAGVLFTKDPVTGADQLITEYVAGLGDELVSGRVDPIRVLIEKQKTETPFDKKQLAHLARKVEELFGVPQDIEWAWADNKIWLVQARPITTTGKRQQGYDLGSVEELFYWGPSRATPLYMGDFIAAIERVFLEMTRNPTLPTPPKTLVLFHDGKVVWLNNAAEFAEFVEKTFEAYNSAGRLEQDIGSWRAITEHLPSLKGKELTDELIKAWCFTELAEFSLYGAESFITKKLKRFDERTLPKIWGAFSISDQPTFLNVLDSELASSDVKTMAKKYPWIRDGYAGPNNEARWYFSKRLKTIKKDGLITQENNEQTRQAMIDEYRLTTSEISLMTLARHLAEFMDQRKEWMMQTRRLIQKPLSNVLDGFYFEDGVISLINKCDTDELWERYVNFKSSSSVINGTVANTGGRHFLSGEVAVLSSHTDPVENDKILVVPSTSPGWVPLMRHARALVTDHGGMMSHAAIVAREFNLPCIVGTKQGTKVLKTGDKIVLDLVKGEIIN